MKHTLEELADASDDGKGNFTIRHRGTNSRNRAETGGKPWEANTQKINSRGDVSPVISGYGDIPDEAVDELLRKREPGPGSEADS